MAFVPETVYATDYAHLGSVVKDATFTPKDAAGQGAVDRAVKILWDEITIADYAGGSFSPSNQDSSLVFWAAGSGSPTPQSGDKILENSIAYYVLAVTTSRRSSWRITVRKGEVNA